MAATTLGFIPLQLIPTNTMNAFNMERGFPANGTYVVVKTPTVAQQLQLTKSLKEIKEGREVNNNIIANKPVILRCKRRVDFTGIGCKLVDNHNPSVSRRNERERKRVKMVNMGFETLRQHVPSGRKNKKMSKVETLRSAVQYIKQLQELLDGEDSSVADLLTNNVNMELIQDQVSQIINATKQAEMEEADNANCNMAPVSGPVTTDAAVPLSPHSNAQYSPAQVYDQYSPVDRAQEQYSQPEDMKYSPQEQYSPAEQCSPQEQYSPVHHPQDQFQIKDNINYSAQKQYSQVCNNQEQYANEHFSPSHTNVQFSQSFQSSNLFPAPAYTQTSSAGSLHSPTSSVVSDSSYDSVGDAAAQEDDDFLGFSSWF